jgi:hypothetical protein
VVLPDNHTEGREHGEQVVASLRGVAKRIRVLDIGKHWDGCPDKGDISDWLAAGGSAEKLKAIVDTLPEVATSVDNQDSGDKPKQPKQADILIVLAEKNVGELFHHRDRAYADIAVGGHRETWQIRSSRFRQWLKRLYFSEQKKTPTFEAVQEAVDHVEAKALFEGQEREVYLRFAGHGNQIYIDLGGADWQAVEIDDGGWRLVDEPPVRFRRPLGLVPLATPVRGGSIKQLKHFLNVRDEDGDEGDFVLLIAWLLAALRPRGPYPVLAVSGEPGTAKSTLVAMLRSLIDPNLSPLRALPREDRELFIQATNSWLQAFDNLSDLPHWISDTLCRLASGGGFAVRQLHTDQDEILFDACRPIVLNGIADMVGRTDLKDRTIFIVLNPIDEKDRRSEDVLWAEFNRERPRIFGALLDAITHGLKHLDAVKLDGLPRMADFAKWATACEGAAWPAGTFKKAYDGNQREATEVLIEGDLVATAIKKLMATRIRWEGMPTDLKEALEVVTFGADPGQRRPPKGWPTDPRHLGGAVRRAASALRKVGIYIERGKGRERRRIIITTVKPSDNIRNPSSPLSRLSPDCEINGLDRDKQESSLSPPLSPNDARDNGDDPVTTNVSGRCHTNPLKTKDGDNGDKRDDEIRPLLGDGDREWPEGIPGITARRVPDELLPDFLGCDPGPFPDILRREVPPDRRPALGPLGDSVDDLK